MNPQISNLILVLGIVQVARRLDLENPEVLIYVRIGYLVSQTIILSACYFAAIKIKGKNDLTALKYVEPAKPFTNEQPKLVETSNRDYDLSKVQELLKQTLIGVVVMLVLHFYWNFTQPLFIQSIIPLKNLYYNKIIQIHLLGKSAEGDLKRPFKEASPFGQLSDSQQPQTDKAAIKKAAKASKSGEKDD